MKKLSENRTAALAILIIVALLAVPVLGGLRLSLAKRSAAREFSKTVCTPDRHGNDLYSDTDKLILTAQSMLEEGKKLAGSEPAYDITQRAERLEKAISNTQNAKKAIVRYESCEALISAARQFYNSMRGNTSDTLDMYLADVNSQESRIERVYRLAYSAYADKLEDITSGFPAELIASLYGIGGGR
ncbi:MAG: hypothetical protein II072_00770 [Clostridia bacterium]|nr:hypothetical protein [Clostridia bacterium]MBQ2111187.1 hypothetical protein [Clostridia bacterium]MBQ3938603.1 hypothetical protein [Clostridia bacterium]